jgi:DNA-binding transcriptional LysR family regulator
MLVRDRLSGVTAFLAAVEEGSFSAAADRLNLTRSAVSKTVSRLEDRLGAALFHRSGRSLRLTSAGQAFYERCQRAVQEIEAGEAEIESERQEITGRLRVSVPVLYGRLCVAPALLRIARDFPGMELDIAFSDRVVGLAEDGFDLAVRLAKPKSAPGLKMRKLTDYDMVVCASPSYLAEHGYPTDLADLSRRACIVYRRPGGPSKWFFPQGGKLVAITPNAPYRLDDLETIATFAKAGVGIAWLPPWLIKSDLDTGDLAPIFSDQPSLKSDVSLLWLDTPYMARRLRLAVDALVASVGYLNTPMEIVRLAAEISSIARVGARASTRSGSL